jgi:hypothetical protein
MNDENLLVYSFYHLWAALEAAWADGNRLRESTQTMLLSKSLRIAFAR